MSRRKSGLKDPGKIAFSVSEVMANMLRWHCFEQGMTIGEAMEDAIADYLVKVGKIKSIDEIIKQEQVS